MKIVLLAAASDIHAVRWANKLSENGHEVHLCYVTNHKPRIDKFEERVILHELLVPAPFGYYLNVIQLKNIVKKVKPDIVNSHYASGYGTLGRLLNFSPYIISVYGGDVYDFPYESKTNMNIIRKNLIFADKIASTSKAMAEQTKRLLGDNLKDIYITPFGVDVAKFSKQNIDRKGKDFIVGSVKKLSPKYGMKYGIYAVHHLITRLLEHDAKDINIKYMIYGEGEEKEDLKLLVKKLGMDNVVEFGGRIPNDEVPKVLNTFDVFIGNSILDSESFGVAVVEAMSCEVPVIVSDVDGFKEVVDYGKAGVIVKRKDHIALANALYDLILDDEKRANLAVKARERVLLEYNWVENVKIMERIYENMVK